MIPESIKSRKPNGREIRHKNGHYYAYKAEGCYGRDAHKSKSRSLGCIGQICEGMGFVPGKKKPCAEEFITKEYGAARTVTAAGAGLFGTPGECFPSEFMVVGCRDTGGKPLEGIRVTEDGIIRRFHNGLLDGDSYTPEGKRITQPAVEGLGHLEYWREGCLHRDGGLPAVSAKGFTRREWWEQGERVKCEDNILE